MINIIDLNFEDLKIPESALWEQMYRYTLDRILGDDDDIVEKDVPMLRLLDGLVERDVRFWYLADTRLIDALYENHFNWKGHYPHRCIPIKSWEREELLKRWDHMSIIKGTSRTRLKGCQYTSLLDRDKMTITRQSLKTQLSFLKGKASRYGAWVTAIYFDLLLGDTHRATIKKCKSFSALEITLPDQTVVYLAPDCEMLVVDGVPMSMEQAIRMDVFCKSGNKPGGGWDINHYVDSLLLRHDVGICDDATRLGLTTGYKL